MAGCYAQSTALCTAVNTVCQSVALIKHGTAQIKDFTYVLKYLKGGKGPKMCKIMQTQRKCFTTEHVDELCQNTFTHC